MRSAVACEQQMILLRVLLRFPKPTRVLLALIFRMSVLDLKMSAVACEDQPPSRIDSDAVKRKLSRTSSRTEQNLVRADEEEEEAESPHGACVETPHHCRSRSGLRGSQRFSLRSGRVHGVTSPRRTWDHRSTPKGGGFHGRKTPVPREALCRASGVGVRGSLG